MSSQHSILWSHYHIFVQHMQCMTVCAQAMIITFGTAHPKRYWNLFWLLQSHKIIPNTGANLNYSPPPPPPHQTETTPSPHTRLKATNLIVWVWGRYYTINRILPMSNPNAPHSEDTDHWRPRNCKLWLTLGVEGGGGGRLGWFRYATYI